MLGLGLGLGREGNKYIETYIPVPIDPITKYGTDLKLLLQNDPSTVSIRTAANFVVANDQDLSNSNSALQLTGDSSFGCWFYIDALTSTQAIIGNWGSGGNALRIIGTDLYLIIRRDGTQQTIVRPITAGSWHLGIFIHDQTNSLAKLYLNGVMYTVGFTGATNNMNPFALSDSVTFPLGGGIDVPFYYSKALSTSECDDIWNGGDGQSPSEMDTDSLTEIWPVNEESSTRIGYLGNYDLTDVGSIDARIGKVFCKIEDEFESIPKVSEWKDLSSFNSDASNDDIDSRIRWDKAGSYLFAPTTAVDDGNSLKILDLWDDIKTSATGSISFRMKYFENGSGGMDSFHIGAHSATINFRLSITFGSGNLSLITNGANGFWVGTSNDNQGGPLIDSVYTLTCNGTDIKAYRDGLDMGFNVVLGDDNAWWDTLTNNIGPVVIGGHFGPNKKETAHYGFLVTTVDVRDDIIGIRDYFNALP